MSFLLGPMKKKIEGRKKLVENQVVKLEVANEIYLPLVSGNSKANVKVNEGDYVKIGDMVALFEGKFYIPLFATVSGTVKGIKKLPGSNGRLCEHLVIENDHKDCLKESKGLDYEKVDRQAIVDFIKEIGLTGQGGAGFPTYVKYQISNCETLIINAVECEPYLCCDDAGIKSYEEDFKTGVLAFLKACDAKVCYIAVKDYKKELISKIEVLFKDFAKVKVKPVKDVYPMGWERTLIFEILNKTYNSIPIEIQAVVSNASSAISLGKSLKSGIASYEKIVTVSGEGIKKPRNLLVRIGTPISSLIDACEGFCFEEVNLILGGPMMGTSVLNANGVVDRNLNGVTVLKHEQIDSNACLRCGLCVDYCPQSLQPCNINQALKLKDKGRISKLKALDCVECGMCTYVCPSKLSVTDGVRMAKKMLQEVK